MSTGTPVAPEQAPFSKRVLKLEHASNIGPLLHIALWIGMLSLGLFVPAATNWYLAVPLIIVLSLLNLSLTIGVMHMHTHRPLFVSKFPNRVVDFLCCLPGNLTAAEMREVHVLNHHRFNDGPGDVTSTTGMEKGLGAIWYWVRYGVIVKIHTMRMVFAPDPAPRRKRTRHQFLLDMALYAIVIGTVWYLVDFDRFVLFYWVPFLITQVNAGYFAWLSHAPAKEFEDDPSTSLNNAGNVLNFLIFNQGYHSVHHRYPGIHWSQIPDKLDYMRDVNPGVIVPYWMVAQSGWRLFWPGGFLNERYGNKWKAKLEKRIEEGTVRSRYLPWFAWI
ncbi:fatty acid desaturase [Nocardia neocaledoniensis]|uniref:fatty acid desaturase n=1 Tax=Nocardia neocaledoniensis TaxID=236511 RepID=UPI00245886BA|nr:fatty acid desaturase [Nocardia neocaledoniensis]